MAKIVKETITITLSKLIKDDIEDVETMLTDELLTTLETVAQELVDESIIVEVTR